MSEPEKREEDRAEGERRHLTSAERQKIYMERAAHKRSAALSEREKKRRRTVILAAVGAVAAVALIVGLWALFARVIIPGSRYSRAMELYEAGDYAAAMDAFDAMGDYRDSREYVKKCILEQARALAGRDDVITGTSADMPWFSFDKDDEAGILKFDAELYSGGGDVSIPDVFDGVLVRGIAVRSFYRCDFLTSVSLPPSVKVIRERAFYGCERLAELVLPDTLTEIGEYAFGKCPALSFVRFGSGIKTIDQRAFADCTALESLELPEGLTVIGYRAFGGCSGLGSVSLPSTLEKVEGQAFVGCDGVKRLNYAGSRARLEELLAGGGEALLKAETINTSGD